MGLKINNSNISQLKINGTNIEMVKFNGSIIFDGEDLTITLTFSEKNITFLSNKTGIYDFYYADDNGIISDYEKIVTLSLKKNIKRTYSYFNELNIAPYQATKIVVCEKNKTNILASYNLPSQFKFDSSKYGNKLYSFGALSDVHIDGDGTDEANASSDLIRALTFFNSNSSFVCVSGDLCKVENSGDDELLMYKNLIDNNATIPVYESRGNHDCRYSITNWESYTGGNLYFEQTYQNDKFIFLGMNAENYGDSCFTTEELDWLETKLESYKNQRVFLFFHVFMPNTCGNINNLYPYSSLDTSSSVISRFIELMTTYKNVIYFSGHSHLEFACQRFGANANIFNNGTTCHRVHIPSCAKPRKNTSGTDSGDTYTYNEGSEGYLVDVYENCIVLRGRDFIKDKYLPIANYCLDTTIQIIN
ncbi:MAG: metallophosphoesterase family protein [Bacilli bacterium]